MNDELKLRTPDYITLTVEEAPVEMLQPHPNQPRRFFDPEAMERLKEDIRLNGILTPLLVEASKEGFYIVSGERRWRAARELGMPTVPCLYLREISGHIGNTLMYSSNLQEPLSVYERHRFLWRVVHRVWAYYYREDLSLEETGYILRYVHNPHHPRLASRVPDWALERFGHLKEDAEVLLKTMGASLKETAQFLAAWEGLHPLAQEALEQGKTYWKGGQRISAWIKKMRKALPAHPELEDENLRAFIEMVGRYPDFRLRETLAEERARLLAGQTRPPRRKVMVERVIKRWWRKSAQTRTMEERDELHRMLREIEARVAQVEGFLQGIGVNPWD
jgi:ParB family chromosome partitioning protein